MSSKLYISLSALAGIVCGFFTTHSFFAHSWTSTILWIVVGLAILYFAPKRENAIAAGALFGFFNIATWLITGFQGATTQLYGFSIMVIVLSLLGAACGAFGAIVFFWLFRREY